MGQAFKYGVLAASIAALLLLAGTIISAVNPSGVVSGFGSAVVSFVSVASTFIQNVKGCLNYAIGSAIPINLCLAMCLTVPFLRLTYFITAAVARWINQ